jgi:hypothetical protein
LSNYYMQECEEVEDKFLDVLFFVGEVSLGDTG